MLMRSRRNSCREYRWPPSIRLQHCINWYLWYMARSVSVDVLRPVWLQQIIFFAACTLCHQQGRFWDLVTRKRTSKRYRNCWWGSWWKFARRIHLLFLPSCQFNHIRTTHRFQLCQLSSIVPFANDVDRTLNNTTKVIMFDDRSATGCMATVMEAQHS